VATTQEALQISAIVPNLTVDDLQKSITFYEALGFTIDDARVKRAGLDYHEMSRVREHATLADCLAALGDSRVFAVETTGSQRHDELCYQPGDAFLFGRETAGLPAETLAGWPPERLIRLPMLPGNRSLNLSNAVAVVVFEAWRQLGFAGS